MTKSTKPNLYNEDAQFYDLDDREITKIDIPFYLDYAKEINGPILELACGTGRITIPLAEAGHEIWGLELSETMLEVINNKKKKLTSKTANRIHLIKGDMSNFKLSRKFPLILLPARSFQLLIDEKTENNCLKCIYKHLDDDGHFIIDIGDFVGEKGKDWENEEEVDDWENTDPQTGYKVRRTHIKKEIDTKNQIIHPLINYYITKDDDETNKDDEPSIVTQQSYKYFSADQVRELLTSNDFDILEEFGSYDKKPIKEGSEFIFICRK